MCNVFQFKDKMKRIYNVDNGGKPALGKSYSRQNVPICTKAEENEKQKAQPATKEYLFSSDSL